MSEREQVLEEYIMEPDIGPATLRKYVEAHPHLASDILAVHNQALMADLEAAEGGKADRPPGEARPAGAAARREADQ